MIPCSLPRDGSFVARGRQIGMSGGILHRIIPDQTRLNPYTPKVITKDAGLTDEEFSELL